MARNAISTWVFLLSAWSPGCTCPDPEVVPVPPGEAGRTYGAPPPDAGLRGVPAFFVGTTWESEGNTYLFGPRLRVDGVLAGRDIAPEGGPFRGGHLVGLGPCWGMVWRETTQAWAPMRRTEPACADGESGWQGDVWATWELPGGDRYLDLPDGRVWRSGPDRSFQRPVGESQGSGTPDWVLQFGPSKFRVVPLDRCHRVFALEEPYKVSRAIRMFPPCTPQEGSEGGWAGPAWTSWKSPSGMILSLDGESGSATGGPWTLDRPDRPTPDTGRWQDAAGEVSLGDRGLLTLEGCVARWTVDGATQPLQRVYPTCAQAAK